MISLPRRRLSRVQQCLIVIAGFFLVVAFARLTPAAFATGSQAPRSGEHVLTIYDDGQEKGILTKSDTLRDAFKQAKISLGPNDITEPSLDEKLVSSNYDVTVYRARPVLIVDGANRTKVITAYRTAGQIAKQANITLHDEDKANLQASPDVVADGAVERLVIQRATPFTLVLYGKSVPSYTQAKTVADMIKEKGIKLAASDTVSVAQTSSIIAGMTVEIWRNGVQTVTEQEAMPFPTQQIQDANQPAGYKKVQTPGVNGVQMVTYQVNVQNGVPISKQAIQTVVTQQPVTQIEVVGTKNNYSGSLNDWLLKLRTCETGGNYTRNSGNGYYGAYQFSTSTWNSLNTGYARADLAPPAVQDAAIIANTNRSAGLRTQNPGCYASTGISNKPPAQ